MKVWSTTSGVGLNADGESVIYIFFLFIRLKKMVT